MKVKLIALVAAVLIGVLTFVMVSSAKASTEQEYNNNIANARAYAEKNIPYNSYNCYQKAFSIRNDDEAVYKEFLAQATLLGVDYYNRAVNEYVTLFPYSVEANELYCKMLYASRNYKAVINAALAANERGAAAESVRLMFVECCHMLQGIAGGFDEVQSFLGGYARVKIGDQYGYINQTGQYLLAPLYPNATAMYGTTAAATDGKEWTMINALGFTVARTSKPVDSLGLLIGGKVAVSIAGKYAYTDSSLIIPEDMPYDYACTYKNGVAAVKKGDKWALIGENEELITDYIFEDIILDEFDTCINNGVIFAKKNGAYYMVNAQGESIADRSFENAYPFVSTELAAVCIGGKWGFVDANGNIVIEPAYENAKSFSLGLGAVCVDGKWNYINQQGEFLIKMDFEDCLPFSTNGIAAVKLNGKWQYKQLLSYDN